MEIKNQVVNLAIEQLQTEDIEIIVDNKFNYDIYCKLFTILKLKELTSYRMGYYYGSQIIKTIQQERSNIEILTLDFDEVKKNIYEYFS